MKFSVKRIIRLSLLILVLGLGLFIVKLIWLKPFHINHFFERVFVELMLEEPELLTRIQIPQLKIFYNYDARLSDASKAHQEKLMEMTKKDLRILQRYNYDKLDHSQKLSYDVLKTFLEQYVANEPFLFHDYPVNQFMGVQSEFPEFMANSHIIKEKGDADSYVYRMKLLRKKFGQLIGNLKYREEQGIIPPKFVIERVLKEMKDFVKLKPTKNPLYLALAKKIVTLPATSISENEQVNYLIRAEKNLKEYVYPAYRDLIAYFESLKKKADDKDGVWKLPRGDEYYALKLKEHTTTDLSAAEIHTIGLEEVARLEAEIRGLLDSLGHTGKEIGEHYQELAAMNQFLYPNTDSGRFACVKDYQAIINEATEMVQGLFNTLPKARVDVKRVPEFKEKTAPGAYYNPPALDGSRNGIFFVNQRNMKEIPKWGMRTLAYHEAVPGHHFQFSLQQEIEGVPTFRKVLPFTAYAEGWALYTETLMREYSFYNNPYDLLGHLQADMMRAVRLVVDTGIHSKKWTREQAIEYMMKYTGLKVEEVTSEVERYIVMPGQACAYKIGQLKILELRQKANEALGQKFIIAEFHDVILQNGSLPLSILEQVVNEYIAEKKAQ